MDKARRNRLSQLSQFRQFAGLGLTCSQRRVEARRLAREIKGKAIRDRESGGWSCGTGYSVNPPGWQPGGWGAAGCKWERLKLQTPSSGKALPVAG